MKKQVKFSKQLETPIKGKPTELNFETPPPKLILKALKNTPPPLRGKGYGDLSFWTPGLVVEVSTVADAICLLQGCIRVLRQSLFDRRLEVYASVTNLLKRHRSPDITHYLVHASGPQSPLTTLTLIIRLDITQLEHELWDGEGGGPFQVRTIGQGLRLMNSLMIDEDVNNYVPVDDVKWIYHKAATMLGVPEISKALTLPLLQVLKDCKFSRHKRRIIFENSDLVEEMISALINMPCFSSSTVLSERMMAFLNYCVVFPALMAKNASHWVGPLVVSVLSTASFMSKTIDTVTTTMAEVGAMATKYSTVAGALSFFLDNPLSEHHLRVLSQLGGSIDTTGEAIDGNEFVLSRLELMVAAGRGDLALAIWSAIVATVAPRSHQWLNLPYLAYSHGFGSQSIKCWGAYLFRFLGGDAWLVHPAGDEAVRQGQLALAPFSWSPPLPQDLAHNLVLTIFYYTCHCAVSEMTTKPLANFWQVVITPAFETAYLGGDGDRAIQGYKFLMHLLSESSFVPFNEMRFAGDRMVAIEEVNNLPTRWVAAHADIMAPLVSKAVQSLRDDASRGLLLVNQYLRTCSHFDGDDQVEFVRQLMVVVEQIAQVCGESVEKVVVMLCANFSQSVILKSNVMSWLFGEKDTASLYIKRLDWDNWPEVELFLTDMDRNHQGIVWQWVMDEVPMVVDNIELLGKIICHLDQGDITEVIRWAQSENMFERLQPAKWHLNVLFHHAEVVDVVPILLARMDYQVVEFIQSKPQLFAEYSKDLFTMAENDQDANHRQWLLQGLSAVLAHKISTVLESGTEYDHHTLDDLLCKFKDVGVVPELEESQLVHFPMYLFSQGSTDIEATMDEEPIIDDDDGIDVVLVDTLFDHQLTGRVTRSKAKSKKKKGKRKREEIQVQDTPDSPSEPLSKRRVLVLHEAMTNWTAEDTALLTPQQKHDLEKITLEFMLSLKK